MVNAKHTSQHTAKAPVISLSVHRLSVSIVIAVCAMFGYAGCVSKEAKTGTPSNTGNIMARTSPTQQIALRQNQQLLPGDRAVIGTVESIHAEQIKVDYEDSLQPRYLPVSVAIAKGMEFHPGDRVKMVFNEQQVLVDFHPLGHKDEHHTLLMGTVAEKMAINQEQVTVETEAGQTKSYPLRPLIRSKMAAVPVGVPALFLVDETNHIVDVTFGDRSALETVKRKYRQMSPSN